MKYSIQPRVAEGVNAGTKAVKDVSIILNNNGYIPFYIGSNYNGNYLYRLFILLYDLIRFYIKANKDAVYFIQWPYYNYFMPIFYWIVKRKCNNVELLIHDINSLRNEKHGKWDEKFFRLAKLIIVHSQAMKSYLINKGIDSTKIRILSTFDYLTDEVIEVDRNNSNIIVYAGNLHKSNFLKNISTIANNLVFNCYGKKVDELSEGLKYKGVFKPENVSVLNGSWGLVWDGDSISVCSGTLGNYLKYIAPHKLSLYIVAELPIIIWKESAMAGYVTEKGIGICISSIDEIETIINSVSETEYQSMIFNIRLEAIQLRNGKHLINCLN